MTLGLIATVPAGTVHATTDVIAYEIDCTDALNGQPFGQVVAVTLTDVTAGEQVTLTGSPSVAGNLVTSPPVDGASLQVGHSYWLRCVFTTAAGNQLTAILTLEVVA